MNFKFVYKVCTKSEWQEIKDNGQLVGSRKHLEDGYIHFSDKDQIKGTLNKYFLKQKNLILLKIDALKLDNLIYEQTSDGNMFPHLYSPFDVSNVINEYDITLASNGFHSLPIEF